MSNAMQTHGAPSWIEHHGSDPAEARRFYSKVLGWTVSDLPMKDGSAYPGIMLGESPVGGISPQPVGNGAWRIYITVDDVDDRYGRALEAGASGVDEPFDVPGVGRMATIQDPFGAAIAFITYESQPDGG